MAEKWNPPGAKAKTKFRLVQFASGEWAIEKSETACIAWFPDRGGATECLKSLLPLDAEREY